MIEILMGKDIASQDVPYVPRGTRVRHKKTGLKGCVHCIEYHSAGILSPIPLNIEWDDNDRAFREIGMMHIYANMFTVEPIEKEEPNA